MLDQEIHRLILKAGNTDFRWGMPKLTAMLQTDYGLDPCEDGTLFLFCGGKRNRIKGLTHGPRGFTIITQYLNRKVFQWPEETSDALEISQESYENLLDGYRIEAVLSRREVMKYGLHL